MSFTKIARRNAQRAKHAAQRASKAQWARRHFTTAIKLSERPNSLMDALHLTAIITFDPWTSEVLMISPRVENATYPNQ